MNTEIPQNRKISKVWLIVITAGITFALTLGGVFLLGSHSSHTVTSSGPGADDAQTLWTCGMHPWIIEKEPGLCPICNMKLTPIRKEESDGTASGTSERNIAYWRAPMNPMEIYDKPGKSTMGMDLVPVYEDEIIGGVDVSIDPVTQQNMGIRTEVVKTGPLKRTINTYGHVTYDETRTAEINLKISGWIEKIYADFEGIYVKNNEPLFEIYSPDLIAAQEEYLSSLKRAGENLSLAQSVRRRLEYFDVPESEIRSLEKSRKIQKTITIRSPFSGVVIMKNARQGGFIKAGTTIYTIADLSRVWVDVHIYEYELPWVKQGQTATMTLPYLPGRSLKGKISFIYPYLQAKTRDVVVRLEFENPGFSLKPDMYADIEIITELDGQGLIIPSESVIRSGKRNVVFVTKENNKFSPREVTLGVFLDNGNVQILTGLAPGDVVVTSGQFLLDSESKLKEAIQKMMEVEPPETSPTESGDDFFSDME